MGLGKGDGEEWANGQRGWGEVGEWLEEKSDRVTSCEDFVCRC